MLLGRSFCLSCSSHARTRLASPPVRKENLALHDSKEQWFIGYMTFWLGFIGNMDLLASRHSVDLLCLLKVKWMRATRTTSLQYSRARCLDIRFCATTGSPLADHGKKNVPGVPRARGRGLERLPTRDSQHQSAD